jgi:hypothetical protein
MGTEKRNKRGRHGPQTIFRRAPEHEPYTMLCNSMLQDPRLSLEAKGALVFVLSHPIDWTFTQEWLTTVCRIGRQKAQSIVREWIEYGYCWRQQGREATGRHGAYEYLFSDQPREEVEPAPRVENRTAVAAPRVEKPLSGSTAGGETATTKETKEQRKQRTKDTLPPTPRSRQRRAQGAREGGEHDFISQILNALRGEGFANVVEHLIEPVLRQRRFDAPDALYALREVARSARDADPEQLARARNQVLEQRKISVLPSHLTDAIAGKASLLFETDKERKRREAAERLRATSLQASPATAPRGTSANRQYTIKRGDPQWGPWLDWERAERLAGRHNFATHMEQRGYLIADSEWPPNSQEVAA